MNDLQARYSYRTHFNSLYVKWACAGQHYP
jgi:hypothetical protein